MNIIQISHYAGSLSYGMMFRPYYVSRECVRMGHEVTIIAASYSHLRQKNPDVNEDLQEENIDGIRYIWIKTPTYSGNGLGRIRNMLCFIRKLYKYLPLITSTFVPDAVIAASTYPLDAYPARWIAKKHNAKFVFELHDLWPMSPQVLGHMSKWHPFIMVMQRAEDYWCKNADVVISLLSDAYKHLVTRGMAMEKYHVVPNGVSVDEWAESNAPLPQEHDSLLSALKKEGKFLVGYAGGHSVSNGLDTILDLAVKVMDKPQIHFVLVGSGKDKGKLIRRAGELGLSNVSFLPPVNKLAVPTLLEKMDVMTLVAPDTPISQFGISPNKVFDYMMAARPVLMATNAKNNFISEAQCGFVVSCNDINGLKSRLLELYSAAPDSLSKMGNKGKDYILKNYTYRILAQKFIEALETPNTGESANNNKEADA